MLKIKESLLVLLLTTSAAVQAQIERPKLVVGIVVDQMRMEYLYRFQPYFTKNGFNRLINEGFLYTNMHYNYVPTYTAPGHASIYTGTTPVNHGIIGNGWYHKGLRREFYCTEDSTVTPLGNPSKEKEGLMSPKNLLSTTVTDELKLSTNFKGKVLGVSMKDRGAILPAGHFADRAYWLSDNGNFISSTFYGKEFPQWVTSFNNEKRYMKYVNEGWDLLKDQSVYQISSVDENPYEIMPFAPDKKAVFPYDLKTVYEKEGFKPLKYTPFANNLIIDFAKEVVKTEKLGEDNITDFLALSFSSTDVVGHVTGPRSMETQDIYLRLDESIAELLSFLDSKIGKGQYLLFLTADHSGSENALYLKDHGYEIASIGEKEITQQLKDFSTKSFNSDFILTYSDQNLFLDEEAITKAGKNRYEVINAFTDYLETLPWVKRAYTEEQILNASPTDEHASMIFRGYDKTQNGQIYVLLKPAYMNYMQQGASHGTSYTYDTHVPAIFFGWKIPKGISHNKEVITKIAPTLSQKLSITLPNSTNAEILKEVLTR